MRLADQPDDYNFKITETRVEELFVEKGSKNTFDGEPRMYSQLSDHYGLSATIQLL